jgi:hypothetical protein
MAKKMNVSLEKRNNFQNVLAIVDGFYHLDPLVTTANFFFL